VTAFEMVAARFNDLGLVELQDPTVRPFFARPFRVLDSNRFAHACLESTPLRILDFVGAIDQFVDSTDVLERAARVGAIAGSGIWPT